MNYTAKDHFPSWYQAAKITLSNELITARLDAINEIIADHDMDFWLDIVRIANGMDSLKTTTLPAFVKAFLETDKNFPVNNNENLIKILAGIVLCFRLEAQDLEIDAEENEEEEEEEAAEPAADEEDDASLITTVNIGVSLAILNTGFLGQFDKDQTIPHAEYAKQYLQARSYNERIYDCNSMEVELDELDEKLTESKTALSNEQALTIVQALKAAAKKNIDLAEELNVLSWIFGEYSKSAGKFFPEAGPALMIVYAAIELQEKTPQLHYLVSAKGFLQKILSISNGGKKLTSTSVFDNITTLPADLKSSLLKQYKTRITELTPYLLAILKAEEFDAGQDYSNPYKKITKGGDIKKVIRPEIISTQLYNEIVFLKTLENA